MRLSSQEQYETTPEELQDDLQMIKILARRLKRRGGSKRLRQDLEELLDNRDDSTEENFNGSYL